MALGDKRGDLELRFGSVSPVSPVHNGLCSTEPPSLRPVPGLRGGGTLCGRGRAAAAAFCLPRGSRPFSSRGSTTEPGAAPGRVAAALGPGGGCGGGWGGGGGAKRSPAVVYRGGESWGRSRCGAERSRAAQPGWRRLLVLRAEDAAQGPAAGSRAGRRAAGLAAAGGRLGRRG